MLAVDRDALIMIRAISYRLFRVNGTLHLR
jgi:hypothetical protein